jgi:hypothetical protein
VHGAGNASLQIHPKRGQRKGVRLPFGQEINGGKQAQDAVERRRMRACSLRQVLATARAVFQQVRDAEPGCDEESFGQVWLEMCKDKAFFGR